MASSSGTSSGSSTLIQNSGSKEDLQTLMDERKRKRMISNRESARRSRMRKQKHLDDLIMALVTQLRKENHQIITRININAQNYLNIEAENSVLRAQANELSHRLESLNEIISFLNGSNNGGGNVVDAENSKSFAFTEPVYSFLNPFNLDYLNQPIMASADNIFQY